MQPFYVPGYLILLYQKLNHQLYNMYLRILISLLLTSVSGISFGQPSPCSDTSSMTPLCIDACIVCDINGYTGINNEGVTGQAPPGFCTNTIHHMQWIAFMAGSVNLTLQISVFDCNTNGGLEVGIYESLDCENFQLVSNCDGDIPGNTTQLFTNTQPLVIGQYYYFVMDGNMDDVCYYTINVIDGSTLVNPLNSSGPINGNTSSCVGVPQTYSSPGVTGATEYIWTLDGIYAGSDSTAEFMFDEPGTYQVCLNAYNVCNAAPPTCIIVSVADPAPTLLYETICTGDCVSVADTMLCDPGNYEFHYLLDNGCDSTVLVQVASLPSSVTNLDFNICDGDTIYVAGQPFFQAGQFQEILPNWVGCDSVINLDLGLIICQIQSSAIIQNVACSGGNTGSFTFQVDNGTPPFLYAWENVSNASWNGNGSLTALNETVSVIDLPAGTYLVTITDNFTNQDIIIIEIGSPDPLSTMLTPSDYQGFQVSCYNGSDGTLTASTTGGIPLYSYNWNNGSSQNPLINLAAGTYLLTVTDIFNCSTTVSYVLNSPDSLEADILFTDPNCNGIATGEISVQTISGGVPGYQFSLDGNIFSSDSLYQDLTPGDYSLVVQDSNNCRDTIFGTLNNLLIPEIELGPDITFDLGESVLLPVESNIVLETIVWDSIPGLSCYDCILPLATPYTSTGYSLVATSSSGCTDTDSIYITVNRVSQIYVPNIFSPNDDGINDFVSLFAGISVKQVVAMKVFSRWGELLWEDYDFLPNKLNSGWDGYFRGKKMDAGVFAWYAEVELLDGFHILLEGDITLVRP